MEIIYIFERVVVYADDCGQEPSPIVVCIVAALK